MPTIRVAAVVFRDDVGRVLTVRKKGTQAFMLPGGKREEGEEFIDAAAREVQEELGLHVTTDELKPLGHWHSMAANEPDHELESYVFTYPQTLTQTPVVAAEIDELRWLNEDELRNPSAELKLAPMLQFNAVPAIFGSENAWLAAVRENPEHSVNYIQRWKRIAAEGNDIDGEARLIDAIAPRGARILDAGCGTGRLGGYLAHAGHTVVGVDLDPQLIAAAKEDFPEDELPVTWLVQNLAELDIRTASGERQEFDIIVSAGNVMAFLGTAERKPALKCLHEHLSDTGRLVVGFGAGRGWEFAEFIKMARREGLALRQRYSSWDLQPGAVDLADETFMVASFVKAKPVKVTPGKTAGCATSELPQKPQQ